MAGFLNNLLKKPSKTPGPPKVVPNAKWVTENFKFYRTIGFFADMGKMKERQFLEQVKKRIRPEAAATRDFEGLDVAMVDTKRVWHHDPVDFDRDSNFFIRLIEGLAGISRGILRPLKINITNKHASGEPTLIQFTQDSMLYSIYASTSGDPWLDPGIFHQLNAIFADTGFRFELAAKDGDTRYAIVATPAEKAKLIKERNWRFID